MSRVLCFVLGIALAHLAVLPAQAGARTDAVNVRAALGSCGEPCVISFNEGGEVDTFKAAARAVRRGAKKLVVIDGPCLSACVIFADMARSKVCITNRAKFGFHKATVSEIYLYADGSTASVRTVARTDPPHSRDIASWVKRKGGFPVNGVLVMSAKEAKRFWRHC